MNHVVLDFATFRDFGKVVTQEEAQHENRKINEELARTLFPQFFEEFINNE